MTRTRSSYTSLQREGAINARMYYLALQNPKMTDIFGDLVPKVTCKEKHIEHMSGFSFKNKLVTSWDKRLSLVPERPESFSTEVCYKIYTELTNDHQKLEEMLKYYDNVYTSLASLS